MRKVLFWLRFRGFSSSSAYSVAAGLWGGRASWQRQQRVEKGGLPHRYENWGEGLLFQGTLLVTCFFQAAAFSV